MNTNLKTLALALVAGLILTACADEPACAPKANAPEPAVETATEPKAKQSKCRRARRAKKEKAAEPAADGKQKAPRRRRARKVDPAELPVTGMPDSAE